MSRSGWETLPDDREWSRRPTGCTGVVGRPSGMSASFREPSQMSGIGPEALQDVRELSGGPPG